MMEDNIVPFGGGTYVDLPKVRVLDAAKSADMKHVLVLGWKEDGTFYAASTSSDLSYTSLLAQRFIHAVMTGDFKTGIGDK